MITHQNIVTHWNINHGTLNANYFTLKLASCLKDDSIADINSISPTPLKYIFIHINDFTCQIFREFPKCTCKLKFLGPNTWAGGSFQRTRGNWDLIWFRILALTLNCPSAYSAGISWEHHCPLRCAARCSGAFPCMRSVDGRPALLDSAYSGRHGRA